MRVLRGGVCCQVHDDQMDRGTVRRGRQTLSPVLAEANRTLSPETIASLTVVLGDVLHAKSTGLLIAGAAKVSRHTRPPLFPSFPAT